MVWVFSESVNESKGSVKVADSNSPVYKAEYLRGRT